MLKHHFDIYLRLFPVFSVDSEEGGQRFRYVTEGGGILLMLWEVTRGGGRAAKFSQKTGLRNV